MCSVNTDWLNNYTTLYLLKPKTPIPYGSAIPLLGQLNRNVKLCSPKDKLKKFHASDVSDSLRHKQSNYPPPAEDCGPAHTAVTQGSGFQQGILPPPYMWRGLEIFVTATSGGGRGGGCHSAGRG